MKETQFTNSFKSGRARLSTGSRLVAGALAALALGVSGTAAAQQQYGEEDQLPEDPLQITVGVGLSRDSNVVRLPSGADPAAAGAKSRGDTILKGEVGLRYDHRISRQKLTLDGLVDGYKFFRNSSFDNIGYNLGGNLDWVIGRPFFGRLGARLSSVEPMIQDRPAAGQDRNKIDTQFVYWEGGMRFTPNWALIAGLDYDRRRNTQDRYKDQDLDRKSWEVGGRYVPGTGLELDLVWRHTDGDYLNPMSLTALNTPIVGPAIERDYRQNSLLARFQYAPSEATRFGGQVGWTKRKFNDSRLEDFSGLTLGANLDWALSGITTMRVNVSRGLEPVDYVNTGGYSDVFAIALRPAIRATGLITVLPYYVYSKADFKGIAGGYGDRSDTLNTLGIGVDYELRRNLLLRGDLRHEQRDSNNDAFDFKANIVTLSVRATF